MPTLWLTSGGWCGKRLEERPSAIVMLTNCEEGGRNKCEQYWFSAGVGRTGTYITLDNVLDQIEAESLVDIDGVIVGMRNQRMKMVQTKVIETC